LKNNLKQSPLRTAAMIRFQLDQLGARNAHHEFEHLCRNLAREVICPNILPATGPVSSGGDQGRDFETFVTFINFSKKEHNYFAGHSGESKLIFACSIIKQAKIRAKIESDVASICSGCKPDVIYFFSNQDISVALRHKIQKWCLDTHTVHLEIIDAQALSEQLSSPSTFWIAEKYLDISSEFLPRQTCIEDNEYDNAYQRWIVEGCKPVNYADFIDIKSNLRNAMYEDELKSDLSKWQMAMEKFISDDYPDDLQRRAIYEVCVTELRGKHDLNPRIEQIEIYFQRWGTPNNNGAIRDAAILLSYCSSAVRIGEFNIDKYRLHQLSSSLIKHINKQLSATYSENSKSELLLTRAMASTLQFQYSEKPELRKDDILKWLLRLADSIKKAPLFPLEQFADMLTEIAPHFAYDQDYFKLTSQVDILLADRSKGHIVAEKCRDRALKFLESDLPILAINEFHRAKINWFSSETLKGSLLSSLILSNIYLDLGLSYAAKYHAMAAAYVINFSDQDSIKKMIVQAVSQLARCHYASGDWISYSDIFPLALSLHYHFSIDSDDWQKHSNIQEAVFHFLVMQFLSKKTGVKELQILVETPLRDLEMPEDLRNEILEPELSMETYEKMSPQEVIKKCGDVLNAPPFSDSNTARNYCWRALGITWKVNSTNIYEDIPYIEDFIAILQIAIADFSTIDLGLIPTTVELDAVVSDTMDFHLSEIPDNDRIAFKVRIPKISNDDIVDINDTHAEILSITTRLLWTCSSLPENDIKVKIEQAFKGDLSGKSFLIKPYRELFKAFNNEKGFNDRRKTDTSFYASLEFNYREHDSLSWVNTPGWGYSENKAHEFLENRYRRNVIPIRHTLNRLKKDSKFKTWVNELRSEGYLDWQILGVISNLALNYRIRKICKPNNTQYYSILMSEMMDKEESAGSEFPDDLLYLEYNHILMANLLSSARVWGLENRTQTPDFKAWSKLLNERYFHNVDDIPHDDIIL
jgi:hypothetical protein